MKDRQVLWIEATNSDGCDVSQYLMLSEVRLINAMLKDGITITGVTLCSLPVKDYQGIFGKG